jgi:hypothetical protein
MILHGGKWEKEEKKKSKKENRRNTERKEWAVISCKQ